MEGSDSASPPPGSATSPRARASRPSLGRETSRPKGILKNANTDGIAATTTTMGESEGAQGPEGVKWDEVNLSLNDVNRDSTMKITEPKTPYVRYNAETDEVMDLDKIPGFELGTTERNNHSSTAIDEEMDDAHPEPVASGSGSARSQPSNSSRSSSFSGSRRTSESSRRGSDTSERKMVVVEDLGPGADAEDEGDDEETRQAKKLFKERRTSHYGGEGEVMKRFRARAVVPEPDESDTDDDEAKKAAAQAAQNARNNESAIYDDDDEAEDYAESTHINTNINGRSSSAGQHDRPAMPPIPNGIA